VKKLIMISVLAVFLAVSIAALAGCGSGNSSSNTTDDIQKLADAFVQAEITGNAQAIIDMLPPADRDTYGPILQQSVGQVQGKVDEIHYQVDQPDADHATVTFWGTFEFVDNGQTTPETITQDQAQSLPPMVRQDGQWYFDFSSLMQSQTQSDQGSTAQPQQ